MTLGSLQEHTEESDAKPSSFGDLAVLWVCAGQMLLLVTGRKVSFMTGVKLEVIREIFPTRIKEEIEADAWGLQGQSGASPTGGGKERGTGHSWELK